MTGFGFPGEKLFNRIYHAVKGYKCNQCNRKMPREKLVPYGACSFKCTDERTCGIIARKCECCIHHVAEDAQYFEKCLATGKAFLVSYMCGKDRPCGWDRKLFSPKENQ
jgi:hypothetical protein